MDAHSDILNSSKNKVESPVLSDPLVFPDKKVLSEVLGPAYPVYEELLDIVSRPPYTLVLEWRYYRDGKAWLGKVIHRRKTIFWLSVWKGFFKTSFFFTEKHGGGIMELDIDYKLKQDFEKTRASGRLLPLIIPLNGPEHITDVLRVIDYKMKMK